MNVNERLKKYRTAKKLSQKQVAEHIGVTQGAYSLMESGQSSLTISTFLEIADFLDVNYEELLSDKKTFNRNNFTEYVNISAKAGYIKNHKDTDYLKTLELYKIPGFKDGNHRIFEVEGDSMVPTIYPQDFLICEQISIPKNNILGGTLMVVVMNESLVVKRLYNAHDDKSVDKYLLVSDNNSYKPYSVLKTEVSELWLVKAKITNFFVSSSSSHDARLEALESKVQQLTELLNEPV